MNEARDAADHELRFDCNSSSRLVLGTMIGQ